MVKALSNHIIFRSWFFASHNVREYKREIAFKHRTELEDFHSHIPTLGIVMYIYGYNKR